MKITPLALTLTGASLLALSALTFPASAQTATTPTDNGADCAGTAANTESCINSQSNTGVDEQQNPAAATDNPANQNGNDGTSPNSNSNDDTNNAQKPGSSPGTNSNDDTGTGSSAGSGGSVN